MAHNLPKLIAYKLQLIWKLQENDLPRRYDFAVDILSRTHEDSGYFIEVCLSDEAIFHVCGEVNGRNCRICESQNPHVVLEQGFQI